MPFARVRELDVYYERTGARDGAPLLFINGTGGDLRHRPGLTGALPPERFDVVAYDQRGLGQTSIPEGPYSMEQYGDDAAGLLDALGIESAHVIGVSFGGMVAQHLAIRHPHRVRRLVLACTSSGGAGGASYPLHELEGESDARYRGERFLEICDTRWDAAWRAREPDAFDRLVGMMAARAPIAADADAAREAARGAALQLEARRFHDVYDRLGEIAAPTLVCGGRYDGIAPEANQRALAGRIPHAELALFEGGHLFLLQDGAAFPHIVAFLEATG
ncbi:MAG: alpha/beta hydrolase [Myxococcota bacterium]|nr:alpha/beta fold hydrolase [Myxococcales bacterium]